MTPHSLRQRFFLPIALAALLVFFALGKLAFVVYNSEVETLTPLAFVSLWLRGLPLDLRTSAILLLLPALLSLQRRVSLRLALAPYHVLVALGMAITTVADVVMYEFWRFKLSAVVLSYAASPEGATNSVPASFIISRFAAVGVYALVVASVLIWLTPKRTERRASWWGVPLLVLALLPIGVGTCYSPRQSLFLDHAATNPTFAFASSFRARSSYDFMPPAECDSLVSTLYPEQEDGLTDTLLSLTRPNILVIQMESYGAKFVSELGGVPDVSPNLSRLIPEGVFFDGYYSSSFRTDRGTVSLQSGTLSHPTVSLMRERSLHASLPSLARSLGQAGYHTAFFYAGAMTNMGKREYLTDMDFASLLCDSVFTPEERGEASAWGVHDGPASRKLLRLLAREDSRRPWFYTFQTISSHEPWEVPYSRLSDPVLNAFAYTDQCVGDLVDSLKASPLWDSLLVIILPDHGYLYHQTYEDPEFFHAPLLWTGGAIREPKLIHTLLNQSDLAATLLAQMGLPHEDFPWSRNVFSSSYTYPFVYSSFPAGVMFKDSTGATVFDITSDTPLYEQPSPSPERVLRAKAILQSFNQRLPL